MVKKIKKQFVCYLGSAHQRDRGKYKKNPTTEFKVWTKGVVEQKVFEEICAGVSNGHVAILTIHYKKPKTTTKGG